jgi:magnesium-transporting ATPase (P-type)
MVSEKQASGSNGESSNEKSVFRANTSDTRNTAVSQALPFAPHTAQSSKVLEALSSDAITGLSNEDAAKRLEVHGLNRLKPPKRPSVLKIIVRQIGNAMSLVLSASNTSVDTGMTR